MALPDPPNPLPSISINALFDLLHAYLHFTLGEVTVAIIDGFEFAAIDDDDRLGEEIEVAAKHYELATDAANGFAVVLVRVCNRFEVIELKRTLITTARFRISGFSSPKE